VHPVEGLEAIGAIVLAGDFNRDRLGDLVIGSISLSPGASGLSLLRGRGDGSFERLRFSEPPEGLHAMTAADLDKDGPLDLIVLDAGTIRVMHGTDRGDFAPAATRETLLRPSIFALPITIDLDLDGALDLVMPSGVDVIAWHRGDGRGGIGPGRAISPTVHHSGWLAPYSNGPGQRPSVLVLGQELMALPASCF
jgi:hypothetical protein